MAATSGTYVILSTIATPGKLVEEAVSRVLVRRKESARVDVESPALLSSISDSLSPPISLLLSSMSSEQEEEEESALPMEVEPDSTK